MEPTENDEYARFARAYDFFTSPFLDHIRKDIVRTLRDEDFAEKEVLDVCCGTGRQVMLLRDVGIAAQGLDMSSAMLRQAREKCLLRYVDEQRKHTPFHLADATRMSFYDDTFGGAVIMMALHEKSERVRKDIVAQMRRVVKPGGVLVFVDYVLPKVAVHPLCVLVGLIERYAGKEHYACYKSFIREGGLKGLLEKSGFSGVVVESYLGGTVGMAVLSN